MPDGFDVGIGDIGVKATTDLSAGASEVYARLRESETDSTSQAEAATAIGGVGVYIAPLQLPFLHPPQHTSSEEDITIKRASATQKSQTVLLAQMGASIAESWATSVQKYEEEREDVRASPITQTTTDYFRRIEHADNPSKMSNTHAATATFIVGTASLGLVGVSADSGISTTIATNVISDSMQTVTPLMTAARDDLRAELGLIGGTIMYGMMYQATIETIQQTEEAQGRTITAEFAKNYSNRLLAMCNDENFTDYLKNLITHHMEGAEGASPEQTNTWVTMAKLGMLFSALGLHYQAEAGGQTGAEIIGLLSGSAPPLAASDPKAAVIAQIRVYLGQLNNGDRQGVLANAMQFLDAHKDDTDLTDPLTIVLGLFSGDETLGARRDSQHA